MSKKKGKKANFENKKAVVVEPEKKKGRKETLIGIGVAAFIMALVVFFTFSGGSGLKVVSAEAGVVKIPVAEVSDGQAHYYTYKSSNRNVNFFVLKSSDGVLRAAFDACDVCFREKKGYRQEGDHMVCNNCGQRFESVNINVLKGGCNPAPLTRNIEGKHLVFTAYDIETGRYYF